MKTIVEPKPKSDDIRFTVRTRVVEYGDGRKFQEWRIVAWHKGRPVALEDGPRRQFESSDQNAKQMSRGAGWKRVAELKTHRLFVIYVTAKHIRDGEGRNCHACAISQALWHNQKRMGFPVSDWDFRVNPYGAWTDPEGIVLSPKYGSGPAKHIDSDKLPKVVWPTKNPERFHLPSDDMVHWAMNFDDYKDLETMTLKEWRKKHGYEHGERPFNPGSVSFLLDLDAFTSLN